MTTGALCLTVDIDLDEGWLADDPDNAARPGVLSQGLYEVRRGIPLVLEALRRSEAVATFFIPGRCAERFPHIVDTVLEGGHEVACHGYTHRSPDRLRVNERRDELERGLAILRAAAGEVRGYRAPSWDLDDVTLGMLGGLGVDYSSNLMDDVRPYRHQDGVAELPVSWILDDAAHFWFSGASWEKKISTNSEVAEIWGDELDGIAAVDGVCVVTLHPQIVGRPGRLPLLAQLVERARVRDMPVVRCGDLVDSWWAER